MIGKWLASRKRRVVLATKASIVVGPPRGIDNSAAHLRAELEASLKRLGVEHVELFYIHRREQARPIEEVVGTLKELISEGKIGGYGLSEVAPYTVRRAHEVHPVRAVQNEYSLWTRLPELGMIQTCKELGIAFVPFSPLARGALGQEIVDPATMAKGDFRLNIPRFQSDNWHAQSRSASKRSVALRRSGASVRQRWLLPGRWRKGRISSPYPARVTRSIWPIGLALPTLC